ncbi:MAG: response regulator [Legionella sp.]|nr:response regulator [Legionella sp.]
MKKKIWIIDDYLPMLDCMRIVLELHHYEVEIAQDSQCLLGKKTKPDLILIDYHLPGVDGYNLFEQIKNHSEFKHIPIILMSGHRNIQQISFLYGANDFIAKPFNFDELLEKIAKLCFETCSGNTTAL